MFKLIRLEWKKNNVGKYIRNAVIMAALICLFIFALCYLGIANDPETGVPDAAPGNSAVSPSIELFTSMAFLIFTGVMLSAYIVNAYKNKTMNLMYQRPSCSFQRRGSRCSYRDLDSDGSDRCSSWQPYRSYADLCSANKADSEIQGTFIR